MPKPAWLLTALAGLLACQIPRRAVGPEPFPPREPSKETVVGVFVYDGVYDTELVASYDVFDHAGTVAEKWELSPLVRVVTIGPTLSEIVTAEGLRVLPDHGFADAPRAEILIVPGGIHFDQDVKNLEWVRWLAAASENAKFTIGHSWGSFLLAAAGRLEHRKATTYPASLDRMKHLFPNVEAVSGSRFVHDGTVITSSGGISAYEASLYLVQILYGEKLARSVAGGLVFAPDNLHYSTPKAK